MLEVAVILIMFIGIGLAMQMDVTPRVRVAPVTKPEPAALMAPETSVVPAQAA